MNKFVFFAQFIEVITPKFINYELRITLRVTLVPTPEYRLTLRYRYRFANAVAYGGKPSSCALSHELRIILTPKS